MKYTYENLHGKNLFRFKNKDNVVVDAMSFLDLNCCDKCGLIQHTWSELCWDCDYDFKGEYSALCDKCFNQADYKEAVCQ
jgi:hypothetical protein